MVGQGTSRTFRDDDTVCGSAIHKPFCSAISRGRCPRLHDLLYGRNGRRKPASTRGSGSSPLGSRRPHDREVRDDRQRASPGLVRVILGRARGPAGSLAGAVRRASGLQDPRGVVHPEVSRVRSGQLDEFFDDLSGRGHGSYVCRDLAGAKPEAILCQKPGNR